MPVFKICRRKDDNILNYGMEKQKRVDSRLISVVNKTVSVISESLGYNTY